MTFAGNNHFILSEAASAQQAGKFFKGGEKRSKMRHSEKDIHPPPLTRSWSEKKHCKHGLHQALVWTFTTQNATVVRR